jgi:hypothetical protein
VKRAATNLKRRCYLNKNETSAEKLKTLTGTIFPIIIFLPTTPDFTYNFFNGEGVVGGVKYD